MHGGSFSSWPVLEPSLSENHRPETHVLPSGCSLNAVLDVTHGILYMAVSVPNPRVGQTTVVTVLQDATGAQLTHLMHTACRDVNLSRDAFLPSKALSQCRPLMDSGHTLYLTAPASERACWRPC